MAIVCIVVPFFRFTRSIFTIRKGNPKNRTAVEATDKCPQLTYEKRISQSDFGTVSGMQEASEILVGRRPNH